MSKESTKLLSAIEYGELAAKKIANAKQHVYLMSMTFHNDDEISDNIIKSLVETASRGIEVVVTADSLSYTEPHDFKFSTIATHPIRAGKAIKIKNNLKKQGAGFRWLGRNSNIGFAGRTHIKWLIVDDEVFSFGGVNIDSRSFANIDYMLWQKSPRLANWLIDQHKSIIAADAAGHGMRNRTYSLNNLTTVILDGGIPGNSHIYKRACELAEEAESIVLVSQYCPTAKLSRIIKSKPSIIYFNHPKNASLLNKLIISAGTATTNLKSLYEKATYLHAKFIIFTMPGGKKVAISGSHNFSYSGVIFGTREIAIETTDKTIISQLEAFVDTQVDG